MQLTKSAGGEAPLPPPPDIGSIEELDRLTGTEQLGAIFDQRQKLEERIGKWRKLAERADQRQPIWERACSFRRHAEGLAVLDRVGPEMDALVEQRSLLDETDHVSPLAAQLAGALRSGLTAKHEALTEAIRQAKSQLEADSTWAQLDETSQDEIRASLGLRLPPPLTIAGDDQLKASLESRSLSSWGAEIDSVPERTVRALEEAAAKVKANDPKVVTTTVAIRRGTLSTDTDVQDWLDEHRNKLSEAVAKGPVIVK